MAAGVYVDWTLTFSAYGALYVADVVTVVFRHD
jgi:hypothetical protein